MKTVYVTNYSELNAIWPFMREGLGSLNATVDAEDFVSEIEFFMRHLDIVMERVFGVIAIAHSDGGKPIGFISAFDSSAEHKPPMALVYAAYAIPAQQLNGKTANCMKGLYATVEGWARRNDFKQLKTYSGRTSGAAVRWFGTYGFKLSKLLLTKEL